MATDFGTVILTHMFSKGETINLESIVYGPLYKSYLIEPVLIIVIRSSCLDFGNVLRIFRANKLKMLLG